MPIARPPRPGTAGDQHAEVRMARSNCRRHPNFCVGSQPGGGSSAGTKRPARQRDRRTDGSRLAGSAAPDSTSATASRWPVGTSTRATRVTRVVTPSARAASQCGARWRRGRQAVPGSSVAVCWRSAPSRLGPLRSPHPPGQGGRELVVGDLLQGCGHRRPDAGEDVGGDRRVERVDTQLEGGPHRRVGVEHPPGRPQQVVGELAAGPDVHAHRQVDARAAERGRRVQPAPRHVEAVAGGEHGVDGGRRLRGPAHGIPVLGPGLVAQRRLDDGRAHLPVLLAGHLQHEHVVHVVVVVEAAVLRRA